MTYNASLLTLSPDRLPKPHIRPSTLGLESHPRSSKELKASVSGKRREARQTASISLGHSTAQRIVRRRTPQVIQQPRANIILSTNFSTRFNAFIQRSNWILEMFFPQLQSRFIPFRNVLFASRIIKLFLSVFGSFRGPQSF